MLLFRLAGEPCNEMKCLLLPLPESLCACNREEEEEFQEAIRDRKKHLRPTLIATLHLKFLFATSHLLVVAT